MRQSAMPPRGPFRLRRVKLCAGTTEHSIRTRTKLYIYTCIDGYRRCCIQNVLTLLLYRMGGGTAMSMRACIWTTLPTLHSTSVIQKRSAKTKSRRRRSKNDEIRCIFREVSCHSDQKCVKKGKKNKQQQCSLHHLNIPSFDVLLRLDVSSFCVEDVLPRNLYLYQACAIKCPCL